MIKIPKLEFVFLFMIIALAIVAALILIPINNISGAVTGSPEFQVDLTAYYIPVKVSDGCTYEPADAVQKNVDCEMEGACIIVKKDSKGQCREYIRDYEGHVALRKGPEDNGPISWGGAKSPVEGRTIAVNAIKGSQCYIPYGKTVEIQILKKDGSIDTGNPYAGCYRAEDTGGAFHRQCKIDIFAGIGNAKYKDANSNVNGRKANVWITDCDPTVKSSVVGQPLEVTQDTKITVFTVSKKDPAHGKKQLRDYIAKYRPEAFPEIDEFVDAIYELGVKYGIDPGFALGVSTMESGLGRDTLPKKCKNFFGIKRAPVCWKGFKNYATIYESVDDFYSLIKNHYLLPSRGQDAPNKFTAHKLCQAGDAEKFYCCKIGPQYCYCCDDPSKDPTQYSDWPKTVTTVRKALAKSLPPGEGIGGDSADNPVQYHLKSAFTIMVSHDILGSFKTISQDSDALIEELKTCFHKGKSPKYCQARPTGFSTLEIEEKSVDDEKNYLVKLHKQIPFQGKHTSEIIDNKFAMLIKDEFAPPLVKVLKSPIKSDKIELKLFDEFIAYDAKTYYVACYIDTKKDVNPDFDSVDIKLTPENCGVTSFTDGQKFNIIVRVIDDVGNMNMKMQSGRNNVLLEIKGNTANLIDPIF